MGNMSKTFNFHGNALLETQKNSMHTVLKEETDILTRRETEKLEKKPVSQNKPAHFRLKEYSPKYV